MKVIGYAGNTAVITEEQAKILTHVNMAFGCLTMKGEIKSQHRLMLQAAQLRKWNPQLKLILSVVPQEPAAFTTVSASERLRENLEESCRRLIAEEGFDGIDFDWEYPCVPSNGVDCSPEDRHNFTLLCRSARRGADNAGGGTVSIAAGADVYYIESIEAPDLAQILDYVNIMTYDLRCGFHALTGHHTALYSSTGDIFRNSCDQAARLFAGSGFPPEKLLIGAAFYSRKWDNVKPRCNGFLQLTAAGGGYGPVYHDLTENYINKNGYVRYWDNEAKAPYLFNGSTFISYDDEKSVSLKCHYVKENNLGGIFYWCHENDRSGALIRAIGRTENGFLPG